AGEKALLVHRMSLPVPDPCRRHDLVVGLRLGDAAPDLVRRIFHQAVEVALAEPDGVERVRRWLAGLGPQEKNALAVMGAL
ncbi:MAG TPA: hypothetical protein VIK99_04300, partial [Thermaerobacter sp.]